MKLVCMFTARMTPNQMRSMPSVCGDGRQQRNDDEGEFEKVEEEGEEKDQHVDEDEEAGNGRRQRHEQVFDP